MRTFYRIVKSNPPALDDFKSYKALGIPPLRDDPEALRMWAGISVWATEAQARRQARGLPRLGRYIGELAIPDTGPIRWARTRSGPGHHTLWGDPAAILACVVRVVPV